MCLYQRSFRKWVAILLLFYVLFLDGCAAQRLFKQKHQMAFTYKGDAASVCLVGDFNQWSPFTHCLEQNSKEWKIIVALPTGTHHYAFLLDRTHWVLDPNAMYSERDGFGRQNSVVIVE